MFSAASKVLSYIWGGGTESTGTDNSSNEASPVTNTSNLAKRKEIDGKVTHVFSGHGLIDNEIYFSFDQVVGGARPNVNDSVSVVATRQYPGGGWHAEKVVVSVDWDNDEDHSEEDVVDHPAEIVGKVTHCDGNNTGYINSNVFYDLSKCECVDFLPSEGDWVNVTVEYVGENFTDVVAKTIKPLRLKESDGVISGVKGYHGYIDGEVFFMHDVTKGYSPVKWDLVHYKAVESEQGRSSWRAISIEPCQKPLQTSLKLLQGPLRKSFIEELFSDKEGISIVQKTDFGTVAMGNKKILTLLVQHNGLLPQTFCRCHITAASTQVVIKDVRLVQDRESAHSDCIKFDGQQVQFCPNMILHIDLELQARLPGLEKQLIVLTFEKFKIGCYVMANIVDPMLKLIENSAAYVTGQRQSHIRYHEKLDEKETPWMVPGQRPKRTMKATQYSNRLAHYEVPTDMRKVMRNPDDLVYYAPVLQEDLLYKNYQEKFKYLLHLEEIQMDIDIREFDLHRVCLRHFNEHLALVVPGLAEGRPSVLIGDKVILTDPTDPSGPCFEGFVHEILKDEVLIHFNPDFHRTYTGKDYNVVFTFNRGPLRRCHRAAEMAVDLGENVLFPQKFFPKPSQCMFKTINHPLPMAGKKPTQEMSSGLQFFNTNLNARQRAAVTRIVQGQGRPLPYILFGPPGTGKTVTVVEAVLQIFTKLLASRIIICAPSNSATDLLAMRLHESGKVSTGNMVRLNAAQRSEEGIPECIKHYCSIGDKDLSSRYRIIVTTCVNAGSLYILGIKAGHFTHVFIDEAGQATEPEAMISACLVSLTEGQIILAGDPEQLGPVLRSKYAKHHGLEVSFLERLIHTPLYERDESRFADHGAYDPLLVTKLIDNYRSNSAILSLPSCLFYHDELLIKADPCLTQTFSHWTELPVKGVPVIFHGVRGKDMREGNSPSWFNSMEAVQVVRYLQSVLNDHDIPISCDNIGVITPYRKQVEKIRLLIDKLGMETVKIGSVEEFQGQERQVIIISTVRADETMVGFDQIHTLGFLSNPKRFNVAITRAQALLIVIGNPHVLIQDTYWKALIDYCVELGVYVGCDLPPTSLDL